MNDCGNKTGNAVDKSALVEWMLLPEGDSGDLAGGGSHAGTNAEASDVPADALPALAGALTVLGCHVEGIQPAGDHMLVVGTVSRAWSRAGTDDRGRIAPTAALLCVQHDLFATAG